MAAAAAPASAYHLAREIKLTGSEGWDYLSFDGQGGPARPATAAQPQPRPVIVPDTFEVLVVEP